MAKKMLKFIMISCCFSMISVLSAADKENVPVEKKMTQEARGGKSGGSTSRRGSQGNRETIQKESRSGKQDIRSGKEKIRKQEVQKESRSGKQDIRSGKEKIRKQEVQKESRSGKQDIRSGKEEIKKQEVQKESRSGKQDIRSGKEEIKKQDLQKKGDGVQAIQERQKYSKERFDQNRDRWSKHGSHVRDRFHDRRSRYHVFDNDYWFRFHHSYSDWYFGDDFFWFGPVAWTSIAIWGPWHWSRPIYYYYSDDGYVYYCLEMGQCDFDPVYTYRTSVVQARRIAHLPIKETANQADWMALGAFALAVDDDSTDTPLEYFTLALNKNGKITGAYVDEQSNEPIKIEGAVDEKTQLAAWKFVGKDWPIMETGLYNLTKDETTIFVHYSDSKTETRLLVRLEEKK